MKQESALDAENLLFRLESLPGISNAFFVDNATKDSSTVISVASQKDIPANQARKFLTFGTLDSPGSNSNGRESNTVSFPTEITGGGSLIAPSNSGRYLAIAQTLADSSPAYAPKCKVRIQILERGRLIHDIFVPEKVHGSLYHDGLTGFETFEWSNDDKKLLYCAEAPVDSDTKLVFNVVDCAFVGSLVCRKCRNASLNVDNMIDALPVRNGMQRLPVPFLTQKSDTKKPQFVRYGGGIEAVEADAARPCSWTLKEDFEEDWGEQYVGRRRSALFVLDTNTGAIEPVSNVPEGILPGNAVWTPDNKGVVFTGWDIEQRRINTKRRLGLIYCMNRSTGIYVASLDGENGPCVKLTSRLDSAYCPRFNPSGTKLVFLSSEAAMESGAHYACSSLHELSWENLEYDDLAAAEIREIVPAVYSLASENSTDNPFPGIFGQIGRRAFLNDNLLLMTTQWRSELTVICISLAETKIANVTRIDISDSSCACSVLDVKPGKALVAVSTPTAPAKLHLVKFKNGSLDVELVTPLEEFSPVFPELISTALSSLCHSVFVCSVGQPEDSSQYFEFTCIYPQNGESLPVILVPHGGPHSAFGCQFIASYSFFAHMGFCVVMVNYRGSTGFGQASLNSLHGKIGSQDVGDMLRTLEHLPIAAEGSGFSVDVNRVAVYGGSHGGFLTTHLIGQAPDVFKAAAVRNPVINLPLMHGTTDIPEWCVVEVFGDIGKFSEILGDDEMRAMFDASPLKYVGQVKAPLLLLLGEEDKRVPVTQGLQYHRALQAQGSTSRVIVFEKDCHPIDKPQSAFQATLETVKWFKEHV